MENNTKICKECGEVKKTSQYARKELPDGTLPEALACRNYPNCPKAELEICKCDHSGESHNNLVTSFENESGPNRGERLGKCRINDCGCEKFILRNE